MLSTQIIIKGMSTKHHTKEKGDLGVLKAQADLAERGYIVCSPLTEHASFDIAIYRDGRFTRVQVKYVTAKNGVIKADFRSRWSDSHGAYVKAPDKSEVDLYCIYCPETNRCYYVRPEEIGKGITLRLESPKIKAKNIRIAHDYQNIPA